MLIQQICKVAEEKYNSISLSVAKGNQAINLYKKCGFEIFREDADAFTMRKFLR
jgi:ribosomal protein S18 acetylase RimI-like enzyme